MGTSCAVRVVFSLAKLTKFLHDSTLLIFMGWLIDIFLFSSLIAACDPVSVIAVFEEMHVNAFLFVNVFGEALFNDGISVVIYNIFLAFHELGPENFTTIDYVAGGVSFFVVAAGGVLLGLIFAIIVAFITNRSTTPCAESRTLLKHRATTQLIIDLNVQREVYQAPIAASSYENGAVRSAGIKNRSQTIDEKYNCFT
ncbi:unnamed protein product, partial [Mesorhabditis spiculigera]